MKSVSRRRRKRGKWERKRKKRKFSRNKSLNKSNNSEDMIMKIIRNQKYDSKLKILILSFYTVNYRFKIKNNLAI